jgi:hypothetical protein
VREFAFLIGKALTLWGILIALVFPQVGTWLMFGGLFFLFLWLIFL